MSLSPAWEAFAQQRTSRQQYRANRLSRKRRHRTPVPSKPKKGLGRRVLLCVIVPKSFPGVRCAQVAPGDLAEHHSKLIYDVRETGSSWRYLVTHPKDLRFLHFHTDKAPDGCSLLYGCP